MRPKVWKAKFDQVSTPFVKPSRSFTVKIEITNYIQVGDQKEVVHQAYEAEQRQKGDFTYFLYKNEEGEKVVLKFKEDELVMTRFSTPQSIMRFVDQKQVPVGVHTPMGLQQFISQTDSMQLDISAQTLIMCYQLLSADGESVFAEYDFRLTWTDEGE
nr:DUF1934 domain-containing protein [Streptococcus sp. NLN76]